jgi:hypothetical protein
MLQNNSFIQLWCKYTYFILFLLCITDVLYILGIERAKEEAEMEQHHIFMKKINLFKAKIQVNCTNQLK